MSTLIFYLQNLRIFTSKRSWFQFEVGSLWISHHSIHSICSHVRPCCCPPHSAMVGAGGFSRQPPHRQIYLGDYSALQVLLYLQKNYSAKNSPPWSFFLCANNGNALYNGPWAKACSHRVRPLRSRLRGKCCEMPLLWRLPLPGYYYKKKCSFSLI